MEKKSRELLGAIVVAYKTQRDFANFLGISPVSLSNKLSGKANWKLAEVRRVKKLLGLSDAETISYFNLW